MRQLHIDPPGSVLCLGAHSDDIEIGCGGSILTLLQRFPETTVDWVVLAADGERAGEARAGAAAFLENAARSNVVVKGFRERYFPYLEGLKEYFDELGANLSPGLIFSPWRGDAHQDHRTVAELAANTFRNQLILEYEIPKYDGDLGRPEVYIPLRRAVGDRKIAAIFETFTSQSDRDWFSEETFRSLLRMRGIECRAPEGLAEAFHCRKLVLGL